MSAKRVVAWMLLIVLASMYGHVLGQTGSNDPAELRLRLSAPPTPTPTPTVGPGTPMSTPAPAASEQLRLSLSVPPTPTPIPTVGPGTPTSTPVPSAFEQLRLSLSAPPTPTPIPTVGPGTPAPTPVPAPPDQLRLSLLTPPTPTPTPTVGPGTPTPTPPAITAADLLRLHLQPTTTGEEQGQGSGTLSIQEQVSGPNVLTLALRVAPDGTTGEGSEAGTLAGDDALLLRLFPPSLLPFQDSLIGHWKLDDGNEIVQDSSGNERHGTVHGLSWKEWRHPFSRYYFMNRILSSPGLQFGDGHVAIPNTGGIPDPGTGLTVAAWCYLPDPWFNQIILGTIPSFAGEEQKSGYVLRVDGGQFSPIIWDANGVPYVDSGGMVFAETWTHLAVTWNSGGDMVSYIDGIEVSRIAASEQAVASGADRLSIGAAPWDAAGAPLHGLLADVRLYHQALSAEAIRALTQQPFEIGGWRGGGFSADLHPASHSPAELDQAHEHTRSNDENTEFTLTQSAVEHLEEELIKQVQAKKINDDTKDEILAGIKQLEDRLFDSKGLFLEALELHVGKDALKKLKWRQRWSLSSALVKSAHVDQKYRITTQGLKHLKNTLSEKDFDKLQSLEDRLFANKKDFEEAIQKAVNAEVDSAMAAVGGAAAFDSLLKHTKVDKEYHISDDVLDSLDGRDFSEQVSNRLQSLRSQTFINADHFKEAVREAGVFLSSSKQKKLLEHAEAKSAFKITDNVLNDWERKKIGDIDKLRKLKGQVFRSSRDLLDAAAKAKETTLESMGKQKQDSLVKSARIKVRTPSTEKRRRRRTSRE